MRSSLLVIVLPLVGAIPRGPPGERATKTTVSKRGWPDHDVWNGNSNQPGHGSNWDWSNWQWPDWHWPGSGPDKPDNGKPDNGKPDNGKPGNDKPDDGDDDDSCEPDDDTPKDPTPTKPVETPEVPPTQPSQEPEPPSGDEPAYMKLVNKWMDGCQLRHFEYDNHLESNAFKTSEQANGQLKHHMFDGTMGQVMAMGDMSKFESCFVGGWLCEKRSLLNNPNECDTYGAGWDHQGQTGHAEILSNKRYTKIGCKDYNGILTCDVA